MHTLPVSLQTCQRGQEVLSRIRRLLLFRAGVHKVPHVCTSEWLLFLKFLYCVLGWTPVVLCLFLNVQILISSVCKSIEGNRALSQSLRGGGNYAKKDHDTDRQTDRHFLTVLSCRGTRAYLTSAHTSAAFTSTACKSIYEKSQSHRAATRDPKTQTEQQACLKNWLLDIHKNIRFQRLNLKLIIRHSNGYCLKHPNE